MNEQVVPGRAPSPVETPTSDVLVAPSAPTTHAQLPPIAADADDLRVIKQAVDDAASVSGALWLSYLFVLFYLAVNNSSPTRYPYDQDLDQRSSLLDSQFCRAAGRQPIPAT
jgi:hypothetical protein